VLIEENDGPECAGLCGDRKLGLIKVVPDPHGDKADEQAEDDAERWQHSGRKRLERTSVQGLISIVATAIKWHDVQLFF
jgi:hypothetical protein